MKKFGFYMAAAVISMGISGTAALSAQAGFQTVLIGGNCPSGNYSSLGGNYLSNNNNCSIGNYLSGNNCFPSGQLSNNSCQNLQNILSCLPGYCSTPYSASNNCFGSDNLNNELYFPGQCPGTTCPTQNLPAQNKPTQTNPGTNRPTQTIPDYNKPIQTNPGTNKPNQTTPEENTNKTYVQQVIDLVNQERAKAGLSPLTESSAVSSAAYIRSKEITQNFSHTRPDGSSFSTVLRQNGISFSSSGENIAYGQKTPQEVMNVWMNSSGHRANILNSNYTTIGVGCYQAASGTIYWTQLFTR